MNIVNVVVGGQPHNLPLIYWEPSPGFTENGPKKERKYPQLLGYCAEENASSISEVGGQSCWRPQKGNRNSKRNWIKATSAEQPL